MLFFNASKYKNKIFINEIFFVYVLIVVFTNKKNVSLIVL